MRMKKKLYANLHMLRNCGGSVLVDSSKRKQVFLFCCWSCAQFLGSTSSFFIVVAFLSVSCANDPLHKVIVSRFAGI